MPKILTKINFKLIILGIFFIFIFLYDFDNGITDYLFLIISFVLFIAAFFLSPKIGEYLFITIFVSYFFLLFYGIFFTPYKGAHDHNIFEEDKIIGYKLQSNLNTEFDDNIRSGIISTNSEGFRDDEFIKKDKKTITLVGDSMVFGLKVDQINNLDKQIESICDVDAHNLGVGGYGIPAINEVFSKYKHETSHVIYFFYMNDLRKDNFFNGDDILVYDGYIITKNDTALTEKSEKEIQAQIEIIKNEKYVYSPIKLRYFFMLLKNFLVNVNVYTAPEETLSGYSEKSTSLAVDWTLNLSKKVRERGAKFTVFILPSLKSVISRKYLSEVSDYISLLEDKNIEVIDIFDNVNTNDYISYDGHLSEKGMQKISRKLCEFI